jgi:bifunctional enzyme CysN/CysC
MSVTLLLEDDLDVSRGDMICAADVCAHVARDLRADVCWLDEAPARPSARYLVKHTTRTTRAHITRIEHRVEVDSLRTEADPGTLELNDIGRITLRSARPLAVDAYADSRATGSFILVDEATNATVAAGMIREPLGGGDERSPNVVWERGQATRADRWAALGQTGATVWLTGLPSSGKSAIAAALEARLTAQDHGAYLIDGDNLRHGLSGDLGFDAGSRAENVRRAGEAARMMADAGLVVLVALVSPHARHRERVRRRHAEDGLPFVEIHVDTPLEVCEQRDPKGLYRRARSGTLHGLTGIDDPYEPPARPDLVLDGTAPVDRSVAALERLLAERRIL